MVELMGIFWLIALAWAGWYIVSGVQRFDANERITPHILVDQPILASSGYWRCTSTASYPPTFERTGYPDEADNIRMVTVSNRPSPLFALSVGDLISTMTYRYDDEYLASLDGEIRRLALEQIESDAEHILSAPRLEYSTEYAVLNAGIGRINELSPTTWIANSASSTIFDLDGFPGLVIKYQSNCDNLRRIHPLLRDFWFLRRLEGLGIVPRVFFVSPPTKLAYPLTRKTQTEMPDRERRICTAHPDSMVRYLVMAKAGRSVYRIANDIKTPTRARLTLALNVVRQVVRALQLMHGRGVIHGDIHHGNIVAMDDEETRFGIIDFGLAKFVSENEGQDPKPDEYLARVHCLLSPYALEGWRATYRDDVFNAVFMGALLIYGKPLYDKCSRVSGEELLLIKRNGSFFADRGALDAATDTRRVPPSNRISIQRRLERVAKLAAGVHEFDQLPPYDIIIAELDAAHDLSLR